MHIQVALTVSESKRLIAKGVASLPEVRERLRVGFFALATGSTNAYIYEELTGQSIDKHGFMTGHTIPRKSDRRPHYGVRVADFVMRDGHRVPDLSAAKAVLQMKRGDVFVKGANALNYERRQAAVLIGHSEGGTVGATLGPVVARGIRLIIPVGLEKSVPGDLNEAAAALANAADMPAGEPTLWVLPGRIFTEIEAIRALCGAEAIPIAAGGLAGAEGGVRLLVSADPPALDKLQRILDLIHGEPAF